MSSSMSKTDAYVGKTDLFKVDPRKIVIETGWNPRTNFEIDDLKSSIQINGFYIDKPLLLNRRGAELILVDGERRLRAVRALIEEGEPIVAVPAVLEISQDPAVLLARALAANQNNQPLEPEEEAGAFQRLQAYGWTVNAIAAQVGRSVSYVYARLKLLEASPDVQAARRDGSITTSDAVRVVETAHRENVTQDVALARKKAERKAKKELKEDNRTLDQRDQDTIFEIFDGQGIAWVLRKMMLWESFNSVAELKDYLNHTCAELG